MDAIREAIDERLGGTRKAAAALNIAPSTIQSWKSTGRIPSKHIALVAKAAGMEPGLLVPPTQAIEGSTP